MPSPELQNDILAAVAARFEENARRNLINLQELTESTRFTKQEIMMMYRGFKQVSIGFVIDHWMIMRMRKINSI